MILDLTPVRRMRFPALLLVNVVTILGLCALSFVPLATLSGVYSAPKSLMDVRPRGDGDPETTIVEFAYRGPQKADRFCFWVYPLFAGDPDTIPIHAPPGYKWPERITIFTNQTEASTPMSTFARIQRRGVLPPGKVQAMYTYDSYRDEHNQSVVEQNVFDLSGDGFIPVDISTLAQRDNLSRYAQDICRD